MPYFDRFDIAEAYYVYAVRYGRDDILSQLARMEFTPRLTLRQFYAPRYLEENSRDIYRRLQRREPVDRYVRARKIAQYPWLKG